MNKIVVVRSQGLIFSIEYANGEPVRIFPSKEESVSVGSIYVGRISKIKKDLNAAFVDIQPKVTGYLPFEEIDRDIKEGDLIPVRVIKEPVKTKGYTLSTHLEISGRYVVVTDKGVDIHASSKLKKDLVEEIKSRLSKDYAEHKNGCIIRTNCSLDNYDKLLCEYKKMDGILKDIVDHKEMRTLYSCLYEERPSYVKSLMDLREDSFDEIVTEDEDLYQCLKAVFPLKTKKHESESVSVEAKYRVLRSISLATDKKVNLPSGGYLVIEPTEALTVIDVNSGKFDLKKNRIEMIKKVNYEAANEVAKQLILRNISGMIMVDFINFEDESEEEKLILYMKELLKADLVKTKVYGFTGLKLMEISRQKTRASIYDLMK